MVNTQVIKLKPLLAILASVYTIQSLVSMFTLQGLPAVMRSEGVETSQIGLFYLAMLPWVAKFLWSPLIEYHRKQSNSFKNHTIIIFGSQLALTAALIMLCNVGIIEHQISLFFGVLFMSLFSSFADIATDGLAIDQLKSNKRYLGNVMQVGGAYLGAAIGGGLFIYLTGVVEWRFALISLAIFTLILSLPTLMLLTQKQHAKAEHIRHIPSLKSAFSMPQVRLGLLLVAVSQLGTRGVLAMMMPFLIDKGIELESLGLLVAGGGVVTGLIGVALGGYLLKKIKAVKVLTIMLIAEVVIFSGYLSFELEVVDLSTSIAALYVLNGIITSAKFVSLYTLMMNLASGQQAGVNFSLFQSMDMFIAIVMAIVCGSIISITGYPVHFLSMIALSLVAVCLVPVLIPDTKVPCPSK